MTHEELLALVNTYVQLSRHYNKPDAPEVVRARAALSDVVLALIAERDDANQQLRKEQLTVQGLRDQREVDEALMREALHALNRGESALRFAAIDKLRARLGGV